jgi:hypothetical protein
MQKQSIVYISMSDFMRVLYDSQLLPSRNEPISGLLKTGYPNACCFTKSMKIKGKISVPEMRASLRLGRNFFFGPVNN